MDCKDYIRNYYLDLDNGLSSEQQADLERHLLQCSTCQAFVNADREAGELYASLPDQKLSRERKEMILTIAHNTESCSNFSYLRLFHKKWATVAVSCAVVLLIIVYFWPARNAEVHDTFWRDEQSFRSPSLTAISNRLFTGSALHNAQFLTSGSGDLQLLSQKITDLHFPATSPVRSTDLRIAWLQSEVTALQQKTLIRRKHDE